MAGTLQLVSTFYVKINGQNLASQYFSQITDVTVEQNLHLPDSCTIALHDSNLTLTNSDILPIGADIEVGMGRGESPERIFAGEVTAHDFDVAYGQAAMLYIRAHDRAHRLQRGRSSRSFLNMTDGDIATKIARDSGLRPSVDSTSQVHAYVLQNNQTNLEFLQQRAAAIGFEVYVDGTNLYFRQPHPSDSAILQAVLWDDMIRVHVHMTSTGQVNDVTVRSWDMQNQQAIIGRATQGKATAHGGQQKNGAQLAQPFGAASMTVTRQPVLNQAQADTLAQALADDLAGGAIHVEAEMKGSPTLRPGKVINLEALGSRFSGEYYVASAVHRCGADSAYTTSFTVSGRRSDTLLEMVNGSGHGPSHGADSSIAIGVITNNKDDQGLGRVKVTLPWLCDDETDWARVATPSGGGGRGFYWLPEVHDEVLVAFEHGDPHRPYVIGGLWNGKGAPPQSNNDVIDSSGKVTKRIMKSRTGHTIILDDSDDKSSISILDSSGKNTFTIDTKNNKIILNSQGDLELNATGDIKVSGNNISMQAQSDCTVKATNNASFKGMAVSVQADNDCQIKGATSAKVSGTMVSVEADANLTVKGAIVNIN